MDNKKLANNMSLMLSMTLNLITSVHDIEHCFNHEEIIFLDNCAHNTNQDFLISEQARLVVLAAKYFKYIDDVYGNRHGTH